MTYKQQKANYGMEVDATTIEISIALTFLLNMIKPQYHKNLEIHICGNKAYITM